MEGIKGEGKRERYGILFQFKTFFLKKEKKLVSGAGDVTLPVECLSYEHENMSLIPTTLLEKKSSCGTYYNPNCRDPEKSEAQGPQLVNLAFLASSESVS